MLHVVHAVLLPGYYASNITIGSRIIRAVGVCPQGFVCPGGKPSRVFDPLDPTALSVTETTIQPCADGMWTKGPGATSTEECLTPPGYYTASGKTAKCAAGSYRADWKRAGEATSCVACGEGVLAAMSDRVVQYLPGSNRPSEVAVTTSSEDCCKCWACCGLRRVGMLCICMPWAICIRLCALQP